MHIHHSNEKIPKFDEYEMQRYKYVSRLGVSGEVSKYLDNYTNNYVAIKTVNYSLLNLSYREPSTLFFIKGKHPAFLEIIECLESDLSQKKIKIVLECVPGRELFYELIKEPLFSLSKTKNIFGQLVDAMRVSHNMDIVHRDLKPENIYVWNKGLGKFGVKILDWGYAIDYKVTKIDKASGSPHYAAPEILLDDPIICPANDVWSLGVLLYIMLTKRSPFGGNFGYDNLPKIFEQVRLMTPDYTAPGLTKGAVKLLKNIFTHHTQRISCDDIICDGWLTSPSPEIRFTKKG